MLNLSHKQLDVYQLSLKLVEEIYVHTKNFPQDEKYVLVTQLRRAAISVSSNIAEGFARKSKVEKARFLEVSRSSIVEIDTQIEIALILKYLQIDNIQHMQVYLERCFMMLSKIITSLNGSQ
ncbi:MAG: four helix bundle protein [Bacteroidetes bacterium]|nr:four helix bundle protein [Bacteroidota bacterium]